MAGTARSGSFSKPDRFELGISVLVRHPIRSARVAASQGCERIGTTAGLDLHASFAFVRLGVGKSRD